MYSLPYTVVCYPVLGKIVGPDLLRPSFGANLEKNDERSEKH